MSDPRLWHPFKSRKLSGAEAGWFRPALAVVLTLILPSLVAMGLILAGGPTFSGPPKDGSGYTMLDHTALVLGLLAASFVVSWMMAPFALLFLRAAAMLGIAGWGTAMGTAVVLGVPFVHLALHGDVTSEENAILAHVAVAIAILGLSLWAIYWSLFGLRQWFRRKRMNEDGAR